MRVEAWLRFLILNLTLAACAWVAHEPAVPGPLRMLGAALVVLVVPGAAWLGVLRDPPDAARLGLFVVALSSLSALGGLAAQALVVGGPSLECLLIFTAVFVNLGVILAGPPPRLDRSTSWPLVGAVAAAGFLVTSLAALHLVPPLEDHDMEVRGTAWGLAATLKPYFLTNREVYLPFAHPLLFHVHVADSLVVSGEIGATLRSYSSARDAERDVAAGRPVRWLERWQADYRAFVANPALAGTRAPGALLAALALALLADLVARLTGRPLAGAAAALLYAAFPETLVRAAYAGYFAVAVFAMLAAAMLFDPGRRPSLGWLALAGGLLAVVDHKTVVLVAGVALFAILRRARGETAGLLADRRPVALAIGFALGTLLWWSYGLAVAPRIFVADHLRAHLAHRMLLNDLRLTADPARYAPAMPELWRELAAHTGFVFVPIALVVLLAWLLERGGDDRRLVLAGWFVAGSVAFTLTDWRQTKHLMNQLAPMVAAAVTWIATRSPGRAAAGLRIAAALALVFAFVASLRVDLALVRDFGSLVIHGASDIDGW